MSGGERVLGAQLGIPLALGVPVLASGAAAVAMIELLCGAALRYGALDR